LKLRVIRTKMNHHEGLFQSTELVPLNERGNRVEELVSDNGGAKVGKMEIVDLNGCRLWNIKDIESFVAHIH